MNLPEVPWKATREHHIYAVTISNILTILFPPSQDGTCCLKKYVMPPRFDNAHDIATSTTQPDALLNRLETLHRPLVASSLDNDGDMLQKKLEQGPGYSFSVTGKV